MKKVFDFFEQIHPKIVSPYETLTYVLMDNFFPWFEIRLTFFVDISHPPTISSKPSAAIKYMILDQGGLPKKVLFYIGLAMARE